MSQKLIVGLLIGLLAGMGYLAYSNFKLQRQVEELKGTSGESVTITPSNPAPADNGGNSPFDKKNVDQMMTDLPAESPADMPKTSIKYEKEVHNFGKIEEGEIVRTKFKFTNTGKNVLVIKDARGSCGCTVPNWPKYAIKPGETGEIAVEFNSKGKSGEETKTISVLANTEPATKELTIIAIVMPKN